MQQMIYKKFLMFFRFFFKLIILFSIIYIFPENSKANIYQLSCKNKKNSTVWIYSFKRKQVILRQVNDQKTKVNFEINRSTPSSFVSKGVISKFDTNVTYDKKNWTVIYVTKIISGSNQFYKCKEPKLIKEE